MVDAGTGSASQGPDARDGICAAVASRLTELVAGDLPAAMRRELAPHVEQCARCSAEVAVFRSLVGELRELPVTASASRTWAAIERAIAIERRAAPLPAFVEVGTLAAAGLLVAALLVRHGSALAERLGASPALQPLVLPGLFVLFGAIVSVATLPLLASAARVPQGAGS